MVKEFDIDFVVDGLKVGSSVIQVFDGRINTAVVEDGFFAMLRKNEKSWVEEANFEEKEKMLENLTPEQEEKVKNAHAKDYIGTDDEMPDAYDDWCVNDLSLEDLKEILK